MHKCTVCAAFCWDETLPWATICAMLAASSKEVAFCDERRFALQELVAECLGRQGACMRIEAMQHSGRALRARRASERGRGRE